MTSDERNSILSQMSDLSKDALGYRLRLNFSEMSDEELQSEYDYLLRELERSLAREKDENETAFKSILSYLTKLADDNGVSRQTALRWDMEAEKAFNGGVEDFGFYCYLKGLSSLDLEAKLKKELLT